jgi:hypothetical protein
LILCIIRNKIKEYLKQIMSKPTSSNEQPADTQQTEVPSEKEQCRRLFEIEIEAKFDEKKNTIIEKQK